MVVKVCELLANILPGNCRAPSATPCIKIHRATGDPGSQGRRYIRLRVFRCLPRFASPVYER